MPANERFVRWQGTTISQFGVVNNLIVGLSAGMLGFSIDRVGFAKANSDGWTAFQWSVSLCLLSLTFGIACAISRLVDFRTTAKIARNNMPSHDKVTAREESAALGRLSWRLLWLQLLTFWLAIVLMIASYRSMYRV